MWGPFCLTSIHYKGLSEGHFQVWDFLVALKTHRAILDLQVDRQIAYKLKYYCFPCQDLTYKLT